MAMLSVIDNLERCKIALQYIAERQSDSLTVVLEVLLERLDDAIGQVHTQLRQGVCAGPCPRETPGPAPRGVLTLVPDSRQTPHPPASVPPEEPHAEDELSCPDA